MGSAAVGTYGWPCGAGRAVSHCGLSPRGPLPQVHRLGLSFLSICAVLGVFGFSSDG